jgi:spermidine synthase
MIPWSLLDTAEMPGGSDKLHLWRRGAEFSIRVGRAELMNNRLSGSEKALAARACSRMRERRAPRILIGGLGMGFTLRAALDELGREACVVVAELAPAILRWARGPMAEIFGGSLEDPRVSLREEDVARLIAADRATYDAILLDVDNGPDGLSRKANDRLYDARGLNAARAALRPDGVLAVWSSSPDEGFMRRLRAARFEVEEVGVRANGARGARHIIWLATAHPDSQRRAAT